jgi:hypothetical protein
MIAVAGNHCREWSQKSCRALPFAVSVCPKRRTADTSDRCIALLRSAVSVRRIAPHIPVRIATKAGEKCWLAVSDLPWLKLNQLGLIALAYVRKCTEREFDVFALGKTELVDAATLHER